VTHPEPSPLQTQALQLIWSAFDRDGRWPLFARADRAIYKSTNIALRETLDQVRPWLVSYDPFGHATSSVSLTLAGLARCHGTHDLLAAVLVTVRACVALERDYEPVDDAPGSETVTVGPDQLRGALAPNVTDVSPRLLNQVFAVITSEAIDDGSSGPGPSDPDVWTFQVSDKIRRFRHVETLEDLLVATDRTAPAMAPGIAPTETRPAAPTAPPRPRPAPVTHEYFSDRVEPPAGRELDALTVPAWNGIVSLVEVGVVAALFAEDFPEPCPDGRGVVACDARRFGLALRGDVPSLSWPLTEFAMPTTLAVLASSSSATCTPPLLARSTITRTLTTTTWDSTNPPGRRSFAPTSTACSHATASLTSSVRTATSVTWRHRSSANA
jgi:hypothetical protein